MFCKAEYFPVCRKKLFTFQLLKGNKRMLSRLSRPLTLFADKQNKIIIQLEGPVHLRLTDLTWLIMLVFSTNKFKLTAASREAQPQ